MDKEKLRKKLWKKLEENDRNFRWFFDNYLDKRNLTVNYSTLQIQAKGFHIKTMNPFLEKAIRKYLNE